METQDCLQPGSMLPNITSMATDGRRIGPLSYRHDRNLVLAFVGDGGQEDQRLLLTQLAEHYPAITQDNAEVLAVMDGSRQMAETLKRREHLPFVVLVDEDRRMHRAFGAVDDAGRPSSAVVIADRYNEIQAIYCTAEGHILPTVPEIVERLDFIEIQCPECGVPEWPA
jgi:peroxiredoxin